MITRWASAALKELVWGCAHLNLVEHSGHVVRLLGDTNVDGEGLEVQRVIEAAGQAKADRVTVAEAVAAQPQ